MRIVVLFLVVLGSTMQATAGRSHQSAPRLRMGVPIVNGKLPRAIIERIVRQNFGRFRACYDEGLKKNPTLEGVISTKFVITEKGAVSHPTDGGSTFSDKDVVKCVIDAFTNFSFPEPESGTVSVELPVIFTPPAE